MHSVRFYFSKLGILTWSSSHSYWRADGWYTEERPQLDLAQVSAFPSPLWGVCEPSERWLSHLRKKKKEEEANQVNPRKHSSEHVCPNQNIFCPTCLHSARPAAV